MSLDTYLPEGDGTYIVGSTNGAGSFYYFMPTSPGHVKIGFLVMSTGAYIDDAEYKDVVIFSPDREFDTLESGRYHLEKKGRNSHTVELSSRDNVKRYNVYAQPRLGRFRLLSDR